MEITAIHENEGEDLNNSAICHSIPLCNASWEVMKNTVVTNGLAKNWVEMWDEFIIGVVYCSAQLQSEKPCFLQWSYGYYVRLHRATLLRGTTGRHRVTISRCVKSGSWESVA